MFAGITKYWSLLTALLKAKKEITVTMKEHNWKSTKFFIAIVNIVLSLIAVGMKFVSGELGLYIIFGISALYYVANVVSKMTPTTKDDEFLAAIKDAVLKLGINPEQPPVLPKKEEAPVIPGDQNPK
jgi:hypothetical protein